MLKIKINPKFEINKYDIGLGFVLNRENESKKYIRDRKTISYTLGIIFLCFTFALTVDLVEKVEE